MSERFIPEEVMGQMVEQSETERPVEEIHKATSVVYSPHLVDFRIVPGEGPSEPMWPESTRKEIADRQPSTLIVDSSTSYTPESIAAALPIENIFSTSNTGELRVVHADPHLRGMIRRMNIGMGRGFAGDVLHALKEDDSTLLAQAMSAEMYDAMKRGESMEIVLPAILLTIASASGYQALSRDRYPVNKHSQAEEDQENPPGMSRRQFLRGAAAATGAGLLAKGALHKLVREFNNKTPSVSQSEILREIEDMTRPFVNDLIDMGSSDLRDAVIGLHNIDDITWQQVDGDTNIANRVIVMGDAHEYGLEPNEAYGRLQEVFKAKAVQIIDTILELCENLGIECNMSALRWNFERTFAEYSVLRIRQISDDPQKRLRMEEFRNVLGAYDEEFSDDNFEDVRYFIPSANKEQLPEGGTMYNFAEQRTDPQVYALLNEIFMNYE